MPSRTTPSAASAFGRAPSCSPIPRARDRASRHSGRLSRAGGGWQPLPNAALHGAAGPQPYSGEQAALSSDDFYARMEQLINPSGLDPASAYEETLSALMEQLQTRVASVDRGEAYMAKQAGQVMSMPEGPAIFETTGPWEDYATPSRDMRLLIAMKVLEGLPERVRRYPDLYRLGSESPDQAAARLNALHARRSEERAIEYTRTDGSPLAHHCCGDLRAAWGTRGRLQPE